MFIVKNLIFMILNLILSINLKLKSLLKTPIRFLDSSVNKYIF